jgi:integrase
MTAVTWKSEPSGAVGAYVEAGIAPATRRAYKADLEHFRAWGGDIPTTDIQLAAYLAEQATILKVATLTRRLAAISIAHKAQRLHSPVSSPLVQATMRGVRREHGTAQHQAAPLLREDLFLVLGAMGDRLKDLRDRALLLVGFAGGLRRSELAAINLVDFEQVRQGIILTIRRSKTDQEGLGRRIGIPFGRTIHCPVGALLHWLSAARIEAGPVFRPVDRYGRLSEDPEPRFQASDAKIGGRNRSDWVSRLVSPPDAIAPNRDRHRSVFFAVSTSDPERDWARFSEQRGPIAILNCPIRITR